LINRFSGSEMFTRTGAAEKIGEWELPIWIRRWIEERANVAKTAGAKKIGERKSASRATGRIEEKVSVVG
jgi:hypothetical protein